MTRAWLAAGAHSVVASLWPTPDDTGEIFVQFYRHLRALRASGVAHPEPVALQRAQLALLRSRSWRAQPSQWAAYFLVTKD
jgi:CHAT domain-containing protein